MTWYRTQREVCEYFWKNPDDRKFVGRKIAKGEIRKVDWGYEIVWDSVAKSVAHDTVECGNNTTVSELEGKITLLEEENKNLKARVKELEEVCKDSLFGDNPANDYEELKANYELLHKKFIRMKEWYYMVIAETWRYIKPHYQITKEEYEDQLATAISEKLWREDD